ncbi:MAG TPA: hypothetical protein VFB06_28405 [Streptosporangiaceae bacterium]|nr:hypothetical protein [Streptosporangiaceae bacterium]
MIDGRPAGPVCGPAPLVLTAGPLGVSVYPDANNDSLLASGLTARYYVAVPRAMLATRPDGGGPDFVMRAMIDRPEPDAGYLGGSCTLTTDLSLPDELTAQVTAALANGPKAHPAGQPLVVQPIPVESTIIRLGQSTGVLTAQPERTGPLGGPARTTLLMSSDPAATAAVVGNLRGGRAPFDLRTILTEQFDTGSAAYDVRVRVDACLLYAAYRAALPPDGPRVIGGDLPDDVHDTGLGSGAIRTEIRGTADAALRDWIDRSDPVKAAVAGAVKDILFDPATGDAPMPAVRDWWDRALSGATASLRERAPAPDTTVTSNITLSGPVTAGRAVPVSFDALAAAVAADLAAYLLVVYVGDFTASNAIGE